MLSDLKYFTREGNVYTKKTQTLLYSMIGIMLLVVVAFILYKNPGPGARWGALFIGLLGVGVLVRITSSIKLDAGARKVIVKPSFMSSPKEYAFDDFRNFLISRQTFIITMNGTASLVFEHNGKKRSILLHQIIFYTKPLQKVTDETALIMGIEE